MATNRLVKELYGHEFRNTSKLFGLSCGQIRNRDMVHNGGWYNANGEKLGWGDLSPDDFRRISSELQEGEFFIILYESDSFWKFVKQPGLLGSMADVEPDVNAPGVDLVLEKCAYIIAPGKLYSIDRYGDTSQKSFTRDGLTFEVVTRDKARELTTSVSA